MNQTTHQLENNSRPKGNSPLTETTNRSSKVVRYILQSIDDYIEENIDYGDFIENYLLTPQVASGEKTLYELSQEITRLSKVHINNDFLQAALKQTMIKKDIEVLLHCEGPSVMDFVREGLEIIKNSQTIKEQHKKFYMIVWFFLHYGKTDKKIQEANTIQHEKPLDSKGNYELKYDGYERIDNYSTLGFQNLVTQLRKNGLNGKNLKLALWLIENHTCNFITDENAFLELSIPLFESEPKYFKVLFQLANIYHQASVTFSIDHDLQRPHEVDTSLCDNMSQNMNIYLELKSLLSTTPEIRAKQQLHLDGFMYRLKNKDNIPIYRIEHIKMLIAEIAQ